MTTLRLPARRIAPPAAVPIASTRTAARRAAVDHAEAPARVVAARRVRAAGSIGKIGRPRVAVRARARTAVVALADSTATTRLHRVAGLVRVEAGVAVLAGSTATTRLHGLVGRVLAPLVPVALAVNTNVAIGDHRAAGPANVEDAPEARAADSMRRIGRLPVGVRLRAADARVAHVADLRATIRTSVRGPHAAGSAARSVGVDLAA